jgi:hypothetical protein
MLKSANVVVSDFSVTCLLHRYSLFGLTVVMNGKRRGSEGQKFNLEIMLAVCC